MAAVETTKKQDVLIDHLATRYASVRVENDVTTVSPETDSMFLRVYDGDTAEIGWAIIDCEGKPLAYGGLKPGDVYPVGGIRIE